MTLCKLTKLNHATLYPINFEKQKVTLVLNIFNEKTAKNCRKIQKYETSKSP